MHVKTKLVLLSILFIYIILIKNLKAGEVTLYGKAPDWANTELVFNKYANLITNTEDILVKTTLSEDGSFNVKINLNSTTYIFSHLGIYFLYFYAEPGKEYELILPPKQEKSDADKLNPYFEETKIQLGIANLPEDDINIQMRMFHDSYNPYYNKHVIEAVKKNDFSQLDSDIERIDKLFKKSTNQYFNNYRKYRFALIRHWAFQYEVKGISEKFFVNEPVLYENQAYMELFNQVFNDYFLYHGRTKEGEKIYHDINSLKDYGELRKTLQQNKIFKNDTLLELVILKCLYDEFYNDKFSRNGIITILDTLLRKTTIKEHRAIGIDIRNKITKLLGGFPPPAFELYDADSNLIKLSDYKGKYVYLNFCTCSSYSCIKEFEMLTGIYQRHKDKLEIITISLDPFISSLKSFLVKKNYSWKFLYYSNQPEIMKDYDIRAFPTYFLIGPDGNLINSPAPGPGENFENNLFKIMRSRGDI